MNYKICQAMKEAGIRSAESQRGIRFCTQHCPYDKCIVYEATSTRIEAVQKRVDRAKELVARGYDVRTIAKIMDKGPRTIDRYLSK